MVLPISVFIIAKNEADRIPHSIRSVQGWVDEIIVIDSGSTDTTMQVSKSMGAKVVFHQWEGYGPQKIYGEGLCRNHWVLNIDADEAVDAAMRAHIESLFAEGKEPEKPAYRTPVKTVFMYQDTPPIFAPSNNPIRLYDKRRAGFKPSTVHDSVVTHNGEKAGQLKGMLVHRCFRDLTHWAQKINDYSLMQAQDMIARGRKPKVWRIVAEPFYSFLKAYFLRRYVFYGIDGFVGSMMYVYARMLRLAKARELLKKQRYEAKMNEKRV